MSKEGQRIPVRELGIRFSFIDANAQSPLKSLQYSSKLSISHSSSRKTSLTWTDKSSAATKKKMQVQRGHQNSAAKIRHRDVHTEHSRFSSHTSPWAACLTQAPPGLQAVGYQSTHQLSSHRSSPGLQRTCCFLFY